MCSFLQVDDPEVSEKVEKAVRPCVDMLLTTQFQSGNFPSSLGSCSGDRLVQWCHGAPGWVCMFAQAYKVFTPYSLLLTLALFSVLVPVITSTYHHPFFFTIFGTGNIISINTLFDSVTLMLSLHLFSIRLSDVIFRDPVGWQLST